MGVYIPNMEKPKTCDDCIVPLSKCDFLQKRADDCPIIEIPTPHGRLIDWDAFNSKLEIQYAEGRGKTLAPTILEEEP